MQLNQDDKAAALLQMVIERGDEEAASALNLKDDWLSRNIDFSGDLFARRTCSTSPA